jgi:hypothetical protein
MGTGKASWHRQAPKDLKFQIEDCKPRDYLCRMKFQIGDKVVVLHSNEEGEIVDIINNKMVMVDVRGVKFPAYIDQLDFPYFKRFTEQKLFPGKKEKKFMHSLYE